VTRFMDFLDPVQVEQFYQFLFPIFDTFHLLVPVYFFSLSRYRFSVVLYSALHYIYIVAALG